MRILQEKNAAGVITVNGGVVYVLAQSQVADRMLKFFAPRVAVMKPNTNHLLIALKKTIPGQTTTTTTAPAPAPPPPVTALPAPPQLPNLNFEPDSSQDAKLPERVSMHSNTSSSIPAPPPAPPTEKNGRDDEEEEESGEDDDESGEEDDEEEEEEEGEK